MKTLASFVAAFVLLSTVSFAQNKKSAFETAVMTKTADGKPCVLLNWTKGAENTAYYLVERSADGKEFRQVAIVFTSDEAQWTSYNFQDKNSAPFNGVVFYRIALVNDRKEVAYLPVTKVNVSEEKMITVYPGSGK